MLMRMTPSVHALPLRRLDGGPVSYASMVVEGVVMEVWGLGVLEGCDVRVVLGGSGRGVPVFHVDLVDGGVCGAVEDDAALPGADEREDGSGEEDEEEEEERDPGVEAELELFA